MIEMIENEKRFQDFNISTAKTDEIEFMLTNKTWMVWWTCVCYTYTYSIRVAITRHRLFTATISFSFGPSQSSSQT